MKEPAREEYCRAELSRLRHELEQLQGETPLVRPAVDRQVVAEVVSGWTGIPVGQMVLDEIKAVLTLKERLGERIVGQAHALEAIAQRIRTARANSVTGPGFAPLGTAHSTRVGWGPVEARRSRVANACSPARRTGVAMSAGGA